MTRQWMVRVGMLGVLVALVAALPLGAEARTLTEAGRRPAGPRISSGLGLGTTLGATCMVSGDGSVRCFGSGPPTLVQSSNPRFTPIETPVIVDFVSNAVAIATGGAHACALIVNGTVLCWGANGAGQLGNGGTLENLTGVFVKDPTGTTNLSGAVAIAAGGSHTCAVLVNGTMVCWGSNAQGQLGTGSTSATPSLLPVVVQRQAGVALNSVVAIAAGRAHTCALTAPGFFPLCWGSNGNGRLGDPTKPIPDAQPFPVTVGVTKAIGIVAGESHTCALSFDATMRCWGSNAAGQVGDGAAVGSNVTSPLKVNLSGVIAMATGGGQTCASLVDGTARCWGNNFGGLLDGSADAAPGNIHASPVVVPGVSGAVAMAAGQQQSCGVFANETMRCWGSLSAGGGTLDFRIASLAGVASISGRTIVGGSGHSCARRADSTVACWGTDSSGQLGDGILGGANRSDPAAVRSGPGSAAALTNAAAITAGTAHNCVRMGDGQVRCWGANGGGQLGDPSVTGTNEPAPFIVVDHLSLPGAVALSGVISVAVGVSHSCALLTSGGIKCWGANDQGQLGNGTTSPQFLTSDVVGLGDNGVIGITSGELHSCALLSDSTVRCWGRNTVGQVGNGTTSATPQTTAAAVVGLSDAVAIAAGRSHTCALRVNGAVVCWGDNVFGKLGDGTTQARPSPVAVQGITDAVAIGAGAVHSCAVRVNGTVRCWGGNGFGQLGNNDQSSQELAPVIVRRIVELTVGNPPQVLPFAFELVNIATIEGGDFHTCAVRGDGQPVCWGDNFGGQVGVDPATQFVLTATEVPSFRFNIDPSVTIGAQGRVATVTALVNCPAGDLVQVQVSLTQGAVSGNGVGFGHCTGAITQISAKVVAAGKTGFTEGPADAKADAVVRHGNDVVDTPEWTRAVTISATR